MVVLQLYWENMGVVNPMGKLPVKGKLRHFEAMKKA